MKDPKTKRLVDKELIKKIGKHSCEVCGTFEMICVHHLKSRGSGGPDKLDNLMALCFNHHEEIHRSLVKFVEKYPHTETVLRKKGWDFNLIDKAWRNYNL